jgi:uncharacterized ubiquitin-like protein YukD
MENTVVVILIIPSRKLKVDLEVNLDITATELAIAINVAYELGIDTSNIRNCYIKSERPIALLRGNKTLREFGLRNGSIIKVTA